MNTKRILFQLSITIMITVQALAQVPQHYVARYTGMISDTASLKKEMRHQFWPDTNVRFQFIISHDTICILMIYAQHQTRGKNPAGLINVPVPACISIGGSCNFFPMPGILTGAKKPKMPKGV